MHQQAHPPREQAPPRQTRRAGVPHRAAAEPLDDWRPLGVPGRARLRALQASAGNAAIARLLAGPPPGPAPASPAMIQRQAAPAGRPRRKNPSMRRVEAAEQAGHAAESLRGAMEDARARRAARRAGPEDEAGAVNIALDQADGLTATQASEAQLIVRYPALARGAVRQSDFDMAREQNTGFQRACATFVRTRDLSDASLEGVGSAIEISQQAGAMLEAFTQRRETTLAAIEGRIKGALGHVNAVVRDKSEAEFERARQQWEGVHPSASNEDKARFRSQWGPLTAAEESSLLGEFASPLTVARDAIEVPEPDLRHVQSLCGPLGGNLKTLAAGARGSARAELGIAADMLRHASGMLTVLIDPKRAARALTAELLECENAIQRVIALPRRHDPTMPPGPDNPDPHRFRTRGLETVPGQRPVEIEPLPPPKPGRGA